MTLLRLFISILTVTFIGWNVLYIITFVKSGLRFLEKIFISYGLGLGFVTLEMLLFYFFNIRFDINLIIAPWVIPFLINSIIFIKGKKFSVGRAIETKSIGSKRSALKVFLILGITFEILYALFRALIKPIESYDTIAIYAIKAKVFYLAKSIPQDFFHKLALDLPHPDYPLNIPLQETFVYLFLGNLNDQLVKMLFPLYFIGILGMVYFAIRRFASQTYSLTFTFLLASIPQFNNFATNGYLEIPLAYYYFVSAISLLLWFENKSEIRFLLISAFFTALSGWTKNEGLMYCAINTILILSFFVFENKNLTRKELAYLFAYPGIILSISLPWVYIKKTASLFNSDIDLSNLNIFEIPKMLFYKIGPITYEFQKQFFGFKKWNLLWPIAFLALALNYKKVFIGVQKYATLLILLTISGYMFFYIVSEVEVRFFLSKTWSRFLIHFLPIVVYWLAVILKEDVEKIVE